MRLPLIKRYTTPSGAVTTPATATDGKILLPVNYIQFPFEVACAILFSSDAAAAAGAGAVLFTYDSMSDDDFQPVTISQTLLVITVNDPALPNKAGIAQNDVVKIIGTNVPGIDGEWVVTTTPTPTSYTLTSSISQNAAPMNGRAAIFHMFSSFITQTVVARTYGHLSTGGAKVAVSTAQNSGPCTAVALALSVLTAGSAYLQVLQGAGSR